MIESAEEFIRLRLTGDSSDWQRIKQEDAPAAVWMELVSDHPDMRFWMTFNRNLPDEVIRVLSTDKDSRVRAKIASKKNVSSEVLAALSEDSDEGVASAVAGNPRTPDEVLVRLTDHEWVQVRARARAQLEERASQ